MTVAGYRLSVDRTGSRVTGTGSLRGVLGIWYPVPETRYPTPDPHFPIAGNRQPSREFHHA
jgi:hypothetical protein